MERSGRRTGWVALAAVAGALLLAPPRPADANAETARQYRDGVSASTGPHTACVTFNSEPWLTTHYVGYYGTDWLNTADNSFPRVGDLYYVHIRIATVGNPCSGPYVDPEITLPPGTSLSISASTPVYCFYYPPGGPSWLETTPAGGCPQAAQAPLFGGQYRFDPTQSPYTWPLALGAYMELQIPVVSTIPLSGQSLIGYVHAVADINQTVAASVPVAVGPNDLIFKDGVETGGLGAWGSVVGGGSLTVRSDSAMRNSYWGMQAAANGTNPMYVVDDHPTNQSHYRGRFYFSPGTFNPGETNAHFRAIMFIAFDTAPIQRRVMTIVLKRQGGAYSVMGTVRRDDNVNVTTPFFAVADPTYAHTVEFDWKRSTGPGANNGTFTFWLDNGTPYTISGIDNDTAGVDLVRLGLMSPKLGATGNLYLDEFESRTTTAVGP
jgi:hypothetical protein